MLKACIVLRTLLCKLGASFTLDNLRFLGLWTRLNQPCHLCLLIGCHRGVQKKTNTKNIPQTEFTFVLS